MPRLTLELPAETAALIKEAAKVVGMTPAQFVLRAALDAAAGPEPEDEGDDSVDEPPSPLLRRLLESPSVFDD